MQLEVVERWALACGFRLLVVDGSQDRLVVDAAALGETDAAIAARVVRLLPTLPPALRRTLESMLEAWEDPQD